MTKIDKLLREETTKWHNEPIPLELHQHLRLSWEEYCNWALYNELPVDMEARWFR